MLAAHDFTRFKTTPLVMATGYDFCFAGILEEAGVDIILVGDSLANVMLGLPTTRGVDMEVMSVFVAAVVRGAPHTHVTADMPYLSDETPAKAVANAKRFASLGAHSVKLEGLKTEQVQAVVSEGIPVIGHLGLLPQTAVSFKQVGHGEEERENLVGAALELERAGASALVLEHMDSESAAKITQALRIPTIGIGAGKYVNGQVLVLHDFLGLNKRPPPPFARAFADLRPAGLQGARNYCEAVRSGDFPD